MGNLPKRVMGNLYKYFGMGRVPKIPLIKIGADITGKEYGQVHGPFRPIRAVKVPVLKDLCFLASNS